jgi:hypothetical protein
MFKLNPPAPFLNYCLTPSDPLLPRERGKLNNSFSCPSPLGEGFRVRLISVLGLIGFDNNEEIIDYYVPKKILLLFPDSHIIKFRYK